MTTETPERKYVSNQALQLELKAMRSDFRLWLIIAVVANSTLANVTLPPALGFGGTMVLLAGLGAKVLFFR